MTGAAYHGSKAKWLHVAALAPALLSRSVAVIPGTQKRNTIRQLANIVLSHTHTHKLIQLPKYRCDSFSCFFLTALEDHE